MPVDIVGGVAGAFLSGVWALHDDPYNEVGSLSQIRLVVRTFCARMSSIWSKVLEITLPHTSYFSGDGFNNVIIRAFGSAKIEDTPTPFFCVSTDLSSCNGLVHRNGALWRYVRASMTLTGYLPPLCDTLKDDDGAESVHLLVDGGYVNNLPADVMRKEIGRTRSSRAMWARSRRSPHPTTASRSAAGSPCCAASTRSVRRFRPSAPRCRRWPRSPRSSRTSRQSGSATRR